jgi:hypothetical protein
MKKLDLFGHKVSLTYKKEESHKTYFGGFVSLFLFLAYTLYVCWYMYIMYSG